MKISLRLMFQVGTRDCLIREGGLGGIEVPSLVMELPLEAPVLKELIEKTKKTPGFFVTPQFEFSEEEQSYAAFFALGSIKGVKATDKAERATREIIESTRPTGLIRKVKKIVLTSSSRLKPKTIHGAYQWGYFHVCDDAAAKPLKESDLRGLEVTPIDSLPGTHFISANSVACASSLSWWSKRSATGSQYYYCGGLVYKAGLLSGMPLDIYNTAEPWCSMGLPMLIVSKKFREVCAGGGIQGVTFSPVLEEGSALHLTTKEKWDSMRAMFSSNKNNKFPGV